MRRKSMKPRKDKRVFTNTADRTKVINVKPVIRRGGIRF